MMRTLSLMFLALCLLSCMTAQRTEARNTPVVHQNPEPANTNNLNAMKISGFVKAPENCILPLGDHLPNQDHSHFYHFYQSVTNTQTDPNGLK